MAHKHLHELLRENQEPFQLHNYIATRRSHLISSSSSSSSLRPNKPITNQSSSSSNFSFCKRACSLSFHHSPESNKSPFPSPAKSPSSSLNFFLHIPPKTSAMLLEAALKIHKHSSKPKNGILFGSFFKKLIVWEKSKTTNGVINSSTTTSLRNGLVEFGNRKISNKMSTEDNNYNYNYNSCKLSSAGWSESIEDKSIDMETSSSTKVSDYDEDTEIFCSSPSSPFRFALERSSSDDSQTPDILSPVGLKEKDNNQLEEEGLQKIQVEEEQKKDQCSPVSVLDPPFQDNYDDELESGDERDEEDNDFDVECSYAIVQRTKLQLLNKLRRFERLAELDPVELEKIMSEDEDNDNIVEEEECDYVDELGSSYTQENLQEVVREVLSRSNECHLNKIPADVKRLLLDLIAEEQKSGFDSTGEAMKLRLCKRLKAWKEVESNTIDMMVELDFRKEVDEWKQHKEEVGERARDIEIAIFGLLVEELVC